MKCEHCKDELTIQEGNKLVPCPYCMTSDRLMNSLKRAIADSKKDKKQELAQQLQSILNFLPDYPVMALLEAEHHKVNYNLILMIRDTYQILPFGDQSYIGA
jgi:hypothetical protein